MSDVTRILSAIEAADPHAADQLLPLVYDEVRRLAAQKLAHEKPGQTLSPTALVHEAYLRLVGEGEQPQWNSRGRFFAAAAEAMRRILVENARRKHRAKHGGGRARVDLEGLEVTAPERRDDLLALDEALAQLAATDAQAAELVKLRYFAGLTNRQAAEALGVSPRTADFLWEYLAKGPNLRFVVTSLTAAEREARVLYAEEYCGRGDMENRIKEQQLMLFADRTSTAWLRSNQLRLWFSSLAYVLVQTVRRLGLAETPLAPAQCGSIRLWLFKIGALVRVTVRKVWVALASACPYQEVFARVYTNLRRARPTWPAPAEG